MYNFKPDYDPEEFTTTSAAEFIKEHEDVRSARTRPTSKGIEMAEKTLGLRFADEYKKYLKALGSASYGFV